MKTKFLPANLYVYSAICFATSLCLILLFSSCNDTDTTLHKQFLEARARGHFYANLKVFDEIWEENGENSLARSWFEDHDFKDAILAEWLTRPKTYVWLKRGILNMKNPRLIFNFLKNRLKLECKNNQYTLEDKDKFNKNILKLSLYYISSKFNSTIEIDLLQSIEEITEDNPELNTIKSINQYYLNAPNSLADILYELESGKNLCNIDIQ